jgi:hypothetical protein
MKIRGRNKNARVDFGQPSGTVAFCIVCLARLQGEMPPGVSKNYHRRLRAPY